MAAATSGTSWQRWCRPARGGSADEPRRARDVAVAPRKSRIVPAAAPRPGRGGASSRPRRRLVPAAAAPRRTRRRTAPAPRTAGRVLFEKRRDGRRLAQRLQELDVRVARVDEPHRHAVLGQRLRVGDLRVERRAPRLARRGHVRDGDGDLRRATSRPRRRRDPSPRTVRVRGRRRRSSVDVAAALSPRLVSAECSRRGRGAANAATPRPPRGASDASASSRGRRPERLFGPRAAPRVVEPSERPRLDARMASRARADRLRARDARQRAAHGFDGSCFAETERLVADATAVGRSNAPASAASARSLRIVGGDGRDGVSTSLASAPRRSGALNLVRPTRGDDATPSPRRRRRKPVASSRRRRREKPCRPPPRGGSSRRGAISRCSTSHGSSARRPS